MVTFAPPCRASVALCLLPDTPRAAEDTQDAIDILTDAIVILQDAQDARGSDALKKARCLLQVPCAKGAALALNNILEVIARWDVADALGAVKAAERTVRDVVVLRCLSQAEPWDRPAFIANAAEAFCRPLRLEAGELCSEDRERKALLSLSFHKLRREAQAR